MIGSLVLPRSDRAASFFSKKNAAVAAFTAACLLILVQALNAQQYRIDRGASNALSQYLKANKLPLVGAQVSRDSSGQLQVVLYGFVASELGKSDAEAKARKFLNQPSLFVINRITVNPEIRDLGAARSRGAGQASGGNNWNSVMRQIQRQGSRPAPDMGDIMP